MGKVREKGRWLSCIHPGANVTDLLWTVFLFTLLFRSKSPRLYYIPDTHYIFTRSYLLLSAACTSNVITPLLACHLQNARNHPCNLRVISTGDTCVSHKVHIPLFLFPVFDFLRSVDMSKGVFKLISNIYILPDN